MEYDGSLTIKKNRFGNRFHIIQLPPDTNRSKSSIIFYLGALNALFRLDLNYI